LATNWQKYNTINKKETLKEIADILPNFRDDIEKLLKFAKNWNSLPKNDKEK